MHIGCLEGGLQALPAYLHACNPVPHGSRPGHTRPSLHTLPVRCRRFRHLMLDVGQLLPHSKKDAKLDTKSERGVINEVADMKVRRGGVRQRGQSVLLLGGRRG